MQIAALADDRLDPAVRAKVDALIKLNPDYLKWVDGVADADRARFAFGRRHSHCHPSPQPSSTAPTLVIRMAKTETLTLLTASLITMSSPLPSGLVSAVELATALHVLSLGGLNLQCLLPEPNYGTQVTIGRLGVSLDSDPTQPYRRGQPNWSKVSALSSRRRSESGRLRVLGRPI